MTDKDLTDLRAMADLLARQPVDPRWPRASLDEIVGESNVKVLARMTEAEAVQHLRSTDGIKLFHAYLILATRPNYALRANHPVLAEVCLRFIASSKETDRLLGASDIGIWLEGTQDKNASHALALLVKNHEESDRMRAVAYRSLELINNKKTALECVCRNSEATGSPASVVNEIDWEFVSSFLRCN